MKKKKCCRLDRFGGCHEIGRRYLVGGTVCQVYISGRSVRAVPAVDVSEITRQDEDRVIGRGLCNRSNAASVTVSLSMSALKLAR